MFVRINRLILFGIILCKRNKRIIWFSMIMHITVLWFRSTNIPMPMLFYGSKHDLLSYSHDDVIKWKHFPRYWPFVRGIHRLPVNYPHKGQERRTLMFSLICVWINGWVNNLEAGDLRRYRAHYDVIAMRTTTLLPNMTWHIPFLPLVLQQVLTLRPGAVWNAVCVLVRCVCVTLRSPWTVKRQACAIQYCTLYFKSTTG